MPEPLPRPLSVLRVAICNFLRFVWLGIEHGLVPLHGRTMSRIKIAALAIPAMAMFALGVSVPVRADHEQKTVIEGRCQYPERVARYRNETALILCDTVTISRSTMNATLDFTQRSWGSMAQFTGDLRGGKMTISNVILRDGHRVAATGTCEIFRRNDGKLSVISCLAKAGSRSIAANFEPSRF